MEFNAKVAEKNLFEFLYQVELTITVKYKHFYKHHLPKVNKSFAKK